MSHIELAHDTIRIDHIINAPLTAVWDAHQVTELRSRWSVPDGEDMIYSLDDFRPGGRATYRCGTPGVLEFYADIAYLVIEPRELLVYTETVRRGKQLLATGTVSWEFIDEGTAVRAVVTNQVTSYVGQDMVEGNRNGHTIALRQLATMLESTPMRTDPAL